MPGTYLRSNLTNLKTVDNWPQCPIAGHNGLFQRGGGTRWIVSSIWSAVFNCKILSQRGLNQIQEDAGLLNPRPAPPIVVYWTFASRRRPKGRHLPSANDGFNWWARRYHLHSNPNSNHLTFSYRMADLCRFIEVVFWGRGNLLRWKAQSWRVGDDITMRLLLFF